MIALEILAFASGAAVLLIGFMAAIERLDHGKSLLPGRAITDKHTHHWSKWKEVKSIPIYLYPDPDAGRDLPDRMDVMLRRECLRCGLPETKTVRGA